LVFVRHALTPHAPRITLNAQRIMRILLRSIPLVGLCAACLRAQSFAERVTEAPQGRPAIVSVAPPPAAPRADDYGPTVFTHLATTVLADGRVYLDLGNAYQEVAGPCFYPYGYRCIGYGYPYFAYPIFFYTPVYVAPVYVEPIYVAPVYPTVVYPETGYWVERHRGCYSCVGPSRSFVRPAVIPAGAVRAAPPRAVPGRVLPPRGSRP